MPTERVVMWEQLFSKVAEAAMRVTSDRSQLSDRSRRDLAWLHRAATGMTAHLGGVEHFSVERVPDLVRAALGIRRVAAETLADPEGTLTDGARRDLEWLVTVGGQLLEAFQPFVAEKIV